MGELYEETHLKENKTMNQFFMTMFLFRRLVYVVILVLLKDYPVVQVALCVLSTLSLLLFIIQQMPFHERMLNYQHIMNESLTGVAFSVAYVFTKDLDQASQEFHSYIILAIVGLILGFNILLVLIDTVQSVGELWKILRERGVMSYMRGIKEGIVNKIKNIGKEDLDAPVEITDGDGKDGDLMKTQGTLEASMPMM